MRGCARGLASPRAGPARGRRTRTSRAAPAALYLASPLVYLVGGEDLLLDEELLGRRHPTFVVREIPLLFQALDGPAVLVRGLEPLSAERRVDSVRETLPVLDLVLAPVYGAFGRAAHVVNRDQKLRSYPTLRTSLIGGRSTSSSTYSWNLRPSGVATACRKSESWKRESGMPGSRTWFRRPSWRMRLATARRTE